MSASAAVATSAIGIGLVDLVDLRVSQLNGCACCVDLHAWNRMAIGLRQS